MPISVLLPSPTCSSESRRYGSANASWLSRNHRKHRIAYSAISILEVHSLCNICPTVSQVNLFPPARWKNIWQRQAMHFHTPSLILFHSCWETGNIGRIFRGTCGISLQRETARPTGSQRNPWQYALAWLTANGTDKTPE